MHIDTLTLTLHRQHLYVHPFFRFPFLVVPLSVRVFIIQGNQHSLVRRPQWAILILNHLLHFCLLLPPYIITRNLLIQIFSPSISCNIHSNTLHSLPFLPYRYAGSAPA